MKAMLLFILFFNILSTFQAEAKINIAILNALDSQDGKSVFGGNNYNVNDKIHKKFRDNFSQDDYNLIYKSNVKLNDVWNALHDPEISAVFFIGHSATSSNEKMGIMSPDLIADSSLNNLKNAFRQVHNKLKFLAVISCDSKFIIDTFVKNNEYANNPDLKVVSYDSKIRLDSAMKNSIDVFRSAYLKKQITCNQSEYDESNNLPCTSPVISKPLRDSIFWKQSNFKINYSNYVVTKIIRENFSNTKMNSAVIILNNEVVGFFNECQESRGDCQYQATEIYIKNEILKKNNKLILDSGLSQSTPKELANLGEVIEIQSEQFKNLEGLRSPMGNILGIGKNYYYFNSNRH